MTKFNTPLNELVWQFPSRFSSVTHQIGRVIRRDVIGMTPTQIRITLDRLAGLYPGHYSVGFESKMLGGVPTAHLYNRRMTSEKALSPQNGHVLLVHGGGFSFGSSRTHRALASALVRQASVDVWIPDYRLAPEHPFPEPLDDVLSALTELQNMSPNPVFVAGDSAGGNLALSAVLDALEMNSKSIAGLMLLSPWLDLTPNSSSNQTGQTDQSPFSRLDMVEYATYYLQGTSPEHPRANPLARLLDPLPPVYMEASKVEYLWPELTSFRKAYAKCSSPLVTRFEERALHGWQLFPDVLPEAKRSVSAMSEFIIQNRG
jgi:acetyl esterase/lipase